MTGFRVVNEALFVIQTIQFGGKCSNFGGRIGSLSFKSPSSKLESRTSCQQPCTMQSPDFLLVNQHSSVFGVKIYTFWPILMPKSRADLFYSLEEAKLRRQRRCSCMFWGTPSQLPWSIRFCKSNGYFGKWEFEDKPNLVGKPMKNRGHTHTHIQWRGRGFFMIFGGRTNEGLQPLRAQFWPRQILFPNLIPRSCTSLVVHHHERYSLVSGLFCNEGRCI